MSALPSSGQCIKLRHFLYLKLLSIVFNEVNIFSFIFIFIPTSQLLAVVSTSAERNILFHFYVMGAMFAKRNRAFYSLLAAWIVTEILMTRFEFRSFRLRLTWCTGAKPSSSTHCVRTTSTCCHLTPTSACKCFPPRHSNHCLTHLPVPLPDEGSLLDKGSLPAEGSPPVEGFLSLTRYSALAEQFSQQFPGNDLPSMLAKFSLPVSLAEFRNPLEAPAQEVR